ncbi:hypothetical protein AGOR_G00086180 [Albula goreensis]|uniref:TATA box-binding protein-associated factor RNA polymerase I subunit A n=1 Tax=Albula goreensis TaxID=1534307 RepID=A0A8T3DNH0_9TELE|nr:hypothetical protein AGOR_G00086180 [Albula goreensis]
MYLFKNSEHRCVEHRNTPWLVEHRQPMDDIDAELDAERPEQQDDDELESGRRAKRARLPVRAHTVNEKETPYETGFHRTARICLKKIRDCLFQHQWQEAAEYMSSYFQTLEDTSTARQMVASEIIWRLGTEILHHHPNTNQEDFNSFFERMKNTGVKAYLKVCLEHSFHLLLSGKFDEAKRQLSIAGSWRYGKQSASQDHWMKLIHAYQGFLDYLTWTMKKSCVSVTDDSDEAINQEIHSYFRQASVSLKGILNIPGVWDPFVISYVNMLEFYGDQEGALAVLNEYAYDNRFPPNPNAHVYLYQYLKRQKAPEKKLIKVLQILHTLVPSHELMLEYVSILLKIGNESHLQEAVSVIFSLLDYRGHENNLQAWCCLRDVLKLLETKKLKHHIAVEWESRKSWWPSYHFMAYHARKNFEENADLTTVKAKVAAMLMHGKCNYCRWKLKLFNEAQRQKRLAALKKPARKRKRR